jgi:hypothetical protein
MRIPIVMFGLGLFSVGAKASPQAVLQTFTDETTFLAATGATDNGPIPNDGEFSPAPAFHTWGALPLTFSITTPGTKLHFGTNGVSHLWPGSDWTPFIAGHDIAISGVEDFNVDLPAPECAIGFQVAEITSGNGCGTHPGCTNSPVEMTMLRAGTIVAQVTFDIPDNTAGAFFGVWSNCFFDRVEFRDTSGSTDNEYYGRFFVGSATTAPAQYCTAGTSSIGCNALISVSGTASATASSGFTLSASTVEGAKDGLFFYGSNGRQAAPWGSGTSYQCVVPPVMRGGLLSGVGTAGLCDGTFSQDMNARWCPTCPKPLQNPGAGATVQAQLWYRDPFNTSNQTTSLSDAIEFCVGP